MFHSLGSAWRAAACCFEQHMGLEPELRHVIVYCDMTVRLLRGTWLDSA